MTFRVQLHNIAVVTSIFYLCFTSECTGRWQSNHFNRDTQFNKNKVENSPKYCGCFIILSNIFQREMLPSSRP